MAPEIGDLRGVLHGDTIKLDHATSLPDGQIVAVTVLPVEKTGTLGDGIRRSAGAWADASAEIDAWLIDTQAARGRIA